MMSLSVIYLFYRANECIALFGRMQGPMLSPRYIKDADSHILLKCQPVCLSGFLGPDRVDSSAESQLNRPQA